MKSPHTVFKDLSKRHHLVLTANVPVEESTISLESVLSHGGGTDKYLAHGAVGHTDISASLRTLSLREGPKAKPKKASLFTVTVPKESSRYMLIISPQTLPAGLLELVRHTQGKDHKGLSDSQHHQVYMKHVPQPDEQAYARSLAAKLPLAVNLEQTSHQLILFTAELPDSNQAEHLLRLAIELG